jgi:SNF2 family DNA or RNA helicase
VTAAEDAFLFYRWWGPAAQARAFDWSHRIGQPREDR